MSLILAKYEYSAYKHYRNCIIHLISRVRAHFHNERGMEHFLFVLLIFYFFPRLALSQAKKSIKEMKNIPFYAHSRNEPLFLRAICEAFK